MTKPENPTLHLGGGTVSLRDLFAGLCAAGKLANPDVDYAYPDLADAAYEIADALLVEREKP